MREEDAIPVEARLETGRCELLCEPECGCGKPFIATVLQSAGRTFLRQRHCPACAERLEKQRQNQRVAERLDTRRAQWHGRLQALPKYRHAFDRKLAIAGSLELWQREQVSRTGTRQEPAAVEREARTIEHRLDAALAALAAWRPGPKGIGLVGESGHAKTRLLFTLLERLFVDGLSVEFITATEFSNEVGSRFKDDIRAAKAWTDRLARAGVLLYDDLGKEHLTDRVVKELFNLFDKRASAEKPIFCTANFTGSQLEKRFDAQFPMTGAPIINRLRDCCEFLAL